MVLEEYKIITIQVKMKRSPKKKIAKVT